MKLSSKRRITAKLLLLVFLLQIIYPSTLLALTSGPSQPEVQSFKQAGNDSMVDLFSGDFNYSVPLFELPGPNGGYPFVLNYNAGITPDQEASWVGLGWNLSPGAITRQMRGIPDDFAGGNDKVITELELKTSKTLGIGGGVELELFGGSAVAGQVGLTIFNNNYNGLGYNIDAGAGLPILGKDDKSASIGLNLSLNSEEGINFRPSISFGRAINDKKFTSSIGLGFNSMYGLKSSSIGISNFNESITFSNNTYIPSISMPMKNTNTSGKVRIGGAFAGVFTGGYVNAYFNEQELLENKIENEAFGYLNEQFAGIDDLLDFNREKQGTISKETPNLPIPIHTFDIFAVNAHGFGGSFRPYRTDIGVLRDPISQSKSTSFSVGFDLGPALSHFGGNGSVLTNDSYSMLWNDQNEILEKYGFESNQYNQKYENWYFASSSDNSFINRGNFNQFKDEKPVTANLESINSVNGFKGINPELSKERTPRNQILIPITFSDLLDKENNQILPYFELEPGMENYPKNHIAGFMGITSDGARYIFGLPVYNQEQYELSFSAIETARADLDNYFDGKENNYHLTSTAENPTDNFYQKKSISKYAYAYLLTAVLGTDYIDVEDDGVTQDDLGYWVKFTYGDEGKVNDYYWRNPFRGIVYNEAYYSTEEDDRGSLIYGRKDIRYLTKVETKTHVALFDLQDRKDGKGFATDPEKADLNTTNFKSQKRLNHIELYTRQGLTNQIPIRKIVFFETDTDGNDVDNYYILSDNVPNHQNYNSNDHIGNRGKLTLRSIKFIDGERNASLIKPYEFSYNNNPAYTRFQKDPWGYYYPHESEKRQEIFPYVDQQQYDQPYAAAWSLTSINLPSGSTINVEYEADDYAYVQHKKAMKFIKSSEAALTSGSSVSFELESIGGDNNNYHSIEEYIGNNKYLYFKANVKLTDSKSDYVTGYAEIESYSESNGIGTINLLPNSDAPTLHPLQVIALQHMRVNQPKLMRTQLNDPNTFNVGKVFELIEQTLDDIKSLYAGFYPVASAKWARLIETEPVVDQQGNYENKPMIWIRLNDPSKHKIGGGVRVKSIKYNDGMGSEYGQVYRYETTNELGETISSGVASFEPAVGGEENPLRQPKMYKEKMAVNSSKNLYFEYPFNETYYPGASVGYSKVTVKSLAAHVKEVADANHGSTGKVIHEFYTARDFPVITAESGAPLRKNTNYTVPIPLFGSISKSRLSVSQGYSVLTNDMHGKPKKVSNYRQKDNGEFEISPFSWVSYKYKSKPFYYQGELVNKLDNTFNLEDDQLVVLPGYEHNNGSEVMIMGTQQEIFTDMMKNIANPVEGGVNVNADIIPLLFFVLPVPTVWPNMTSSHTELRMAVTNKVTHQNGFLVETEAYTEGSKVITQNIKWDKITGATILARVSNTYKDENYPYTYNFNQLAYHQYPAIGPAYTNIGVRFICHYFGNAKNKATGNDIANHHLLSIPNGEQFLQPGDEVILSVGDTKGKATCLGQNNGWFEFYSDADYNLQKFFFFSLPNIGSGVIIRPGNRNMLNAQVGSITALTDPTNPAGSFTTQFEYIVPNE